MCVPYVTYSEPFPVLICAHELRFTAKNEHGKELQANEKKRKKDESNNKRKVYLVTRRRNNTLLPTTIK
jgi:hypothetical protein